MTAASNSDARKRQAGAGEPELTDAERGQVNKAFGHEAEANCWRTSCGEGIWSTVARIKAEAVQAERERVVEWLTSDEGLGVIEDALSDRGVNDLEPEDSRHIATMLAAHAKGEARCPTANA